MRSLRWAVASVALAMAVPSGAQPSAALHSGGGALPIAADDLSPAQRAAIEARLAIARAALAARAPSALADVLPLELAFSWPLRVRDGYPQPGYHGTSNFVDHEAAFPDQLLDWNCGARTYDRPNGYNHSGTDFFLWPFPWTKMFDGEVEVVAAAAGVILSKDDGYFDGSCSFNDEPWNAVYVLHVDGTVAWYGHLKRDSTTGKGVGEPVEVGERLGLVGSSGSSTAPHLHFEVHDALGQILDPFAGDCHSGSSLWSAQPPYYDSALNQVSTHDSVPETDGVCNRPEETHLRDDFLPGETVYCATFYRDQLAGQLAQHVVRRPDGTVFAAWDSNSSVPHYASSWWYQSVALPSDAMPGVWTFEVGFEGQQQSHLFTVAPEPSAAAAPIAAMMPLAGLSARRRRGSRGRRAR